MQSVVRSGALRTGASVGVLQHTTGQKKCAVDGPQSFCRLLQGSTFLSCGKYFDLVSTFLASKFVSEERPFLSSFDN